MFQALVELYHLPLALKEVAIGVVVVVVELVVGNGVVVVVVVIVVSIGVVVVVVVLVVVFASGTGWAIGPETTAVAADMATVEPFLLLAVTTIRSVEPRSEDFGVKTMALAEAIARHSEPLLLQRCHS